MLLPCGLLLCKAWGVDKMLRDAIIGELLEPFAARLLGPKRWIYCYKKPNGEVPSRTFLDSLDKRAGASYALSFFRMVIGEQDRLSGQKWHKLAGYPKLAEFKDNSSQTRLIHTTDIGGIVVLLQGFGKKKENKIKKKHLSQAQKMYEEYLSRRELIEKRLKGRRT